VMGVQGPMARSAADLELALDVAAGAEAGEDVAWRLTLPPARRDRLGDFRVAVLPSLDWMPLDAEVAAAVDAVASRLSGLGAKVQVTQPEILGDHREHYALYLTLLAAITSARVPAAERSARLAVMRTRDDEWRLATQRGRDSTASDSLLRMAQRSRHRRAWRAFCPVWDIVLIPPF